MGLARRVAGERRDDGIGDVAHIDGLERRTRRDHRNDRRQTHHRGKAVDEMILAAEQDRGAEDSGIGKARTHRRLAIALAAAIGRGACRSEEHTSELQSLMRISYAVFCLKKKNKRDTTNNNYKPRRK